MQNEQDEEASAGVGEVGMRGELVDMVYWTITLYRYESYGNCILICLGH